MYLKFEQKSRIFVAYIKITFSNPLNDVLHQHLHSCRWLRNRGNKQAYFFWGICHQHASDASLEKEVGTNSWTLNPRRNEPCIALRLCKIASAMAPEIGIWLENLLTIVDRVTMLARIQSGASNPPHKWNFMMARVAKEGLNLAHTDGLNSLSRFLELKLKERESNVTKIAGAYSEGHDQPYPSLHLYTNLFQHSIIRRFPFRYIRTWP